jgi:hypothetical protein
MSEGSMTGRPFGGANEKPDDGPLPGERPDEGEVGADSAQSPRAARGGMSGDVTEVPDGEQTGDRTGRKPGMPDATGPTG